MRIYARWLFGAAAAFNFAVAGGLVFVRPLVGPALHLDPVSGSNLLLLYLTGLFIALFGYAYALIAADPVKHRVFIPFGALGKLLAAACITWTWIAGDVPVRLPMLAGGDVMFALLFLDYLRRTRTV